MKKVSAIAMSALLAATVLVGCGSAGKYKDGSYEAVKKGATSDIKVAVEVKKGKISDVKILEQKETASLIQAAQDNLIPEIIKNQGTEGIEAISGATKSSQAIIDAVGEALQSANK
ncbi:FMN-binding protein [Clostridium sp.]|uniref:FMN-binding protein n=1 Tax=Clostridium sp. TaxID=1506 RepID=UPI002FCC72CB